MCGAYRFTITKQTDTKQLKLFFNKLPTFYNDDI